MREQTVSKDSIAPTLGYNLVLPDSCSLLEDVPAPLFGGRILEWWIEGMVAGTAENSISSLKQETEGAQSSFEFNSNFLHNL